MSCCQPSAGETVDVTFAFPDPAESCLRRADDRGGDDEYRSMSKMPKDARGQRQVLPAMRPGDRRDGGTGRTRQTAATALVSDRTLGREALRVGKFSAGELRVRRLAALDEQPFGRRNVGRRTCRHLCRPLRPVRRVRVDRVERGLAAVQEVPHRDDSGFRTWGGGYLLTRGAGEHEYRPTVYRRARGPARVRLGKSSAQRDTAFIDGRLLRYGWQTLRDLCPAAIASSRLKIPSADLLCPLAVGALNAERMRRS